MRLTVPLGSLVVASSSLIALAVYAAWPADEPDDDEADGEYIPFQDMLDSVAPCDANPDPQPGAPALHQRFVIGNGCVAGGHDDIDGDGHLDFWLAQYSGDGNIAAGFVSVQPRCRGEAVRASW